MPQQRSRADTKLLPCGIPLPTLNLARAPGLAVRMYRAYVVQARSRHAGKFAQEHLLQIGCLEGLSQVRHVLILRREDVLAIAGHKEIGDGALVQGVRDWEGELAVEIDIQDSPVEPALAGEIESALQVRYRANDIAAIVPQE